ncbi:MULTISPECIES: hypothetical protein [unclassified Pseudomonas]|uniref:hypothetical protein n=1 Tax=unclassified Pseudomonas TaxID=196821 RepID=UPI00162008B3|nr:MULTISPECIES: hypothetical protein [unclassified Pseudomonas]MBB6286107.1 hypothetical protein [Pseudomonas sp. SJZ073]MBB6311969.1 hypothetical protein [Pseudomonas sp. JAI120]
MEPDQGVIIMLNEQEHAARLRKSDIQTSIEKCHKIFNCGIFSPENTSSPLFEAAIVALLVNLNDVLQKADKDGQRINIIDYVVMDGKIKDLTSLIRECRNAACHIGSGEHLIEDNKFTFNVVAGRFPSAFEIMGVRLGSDFDDDIAVFYGDKRIYIRRNLLIALEAVTKIYMKEK